MKINILLFIVIPYLLVGFNSFKKNIPDSLIGNYYDITGNDFWAYGVHKNFIISDSKFWDVSKVVSSEKYTKIHLQHAGLKRILKITKTTEHQFMFDFNNERIVCSKSANPEVRKPKNKPYSLRNGTVKILGYVNNIGSYDKNNPSIEFLYHNYIILETTSVYAKIDSLGRFQMEMEILSAQDIMFKFNNKLHVVFVAPNDTLMIDFNPNSPNDMNFQGAHSDVCYDILRTNEQRYQIASGTEDISHLSNHFEEYKEFRDIVYQNQMNYLSEYIKNEYCSELFKTWYKIDSKLNYQNSLLNYKWKNYHEKNKESSMNAYKKYRDNYFEVIDINDTTSSISGLFFFYSMNVGKELSDFRNAYSQSSLKIKDDILNNRFIPLTVDEKNEKISLLATTIMIDSVMNVKHGRLRDIALAQITANEISERRYNNIDYSYNRVKNLIQYEPYLTQLSTHFLDFKKRESEFSAIPVSLWQSESSGEELLKKIISDHKNRIIVLDFWTTSCGPCRRDFKIFSTFKKYLALEANVDIVYLCWGSIEKDWENISKEFKLQGHNYLLTTTQEQYFYNKFKISSFPRYILIDNGGKIVNSNFKRPLNKNNYLLELKNALQQRL